MRSTAPPPGRLNSASRQQYYCERCRVARADPFWEVFDATVMPPAVADTSVRQTVVMNALGHQVQVRGFIFPGGVRGLGVGGILE